MLTNDDGYRNWAIVKENAHYWHRIGKCESDCPWCEVERLETTIRQAGHNLNTSDANEPMDKIRRKDWQAIVAALAGESE